MKRFKHSLSNYKLLTTDFGKLVPCNLTEVLPGDTIQQATSALIRVSPLLAPLMHPCVVRVHHWFVPHRIIWNEWEQFITGGEDGAGDGYTYPTITAGGSGFANGSLPDFLGVPPGVANLEVSALPIRAYNKIFNEYYRDQDLVTAVTEDTTDIQQIAWEKDYFTAARPWTQKGSEVTLPLGGTANVGNAGKSGAVAVQDFSDDSWNLMTANTTHVGYGGSASTEGQGLVADLSEATGASVDEVREAFALQRYKEARARYGSRYTEYLAYLGINSGDARLQRAQYLGGGKQTISFSEVLQTSNDGTNGAVGDMSGHGIAAMRSRRYRKYFQEHGYVISLMSARPRSMYVDGLERTWNRRTKEDYWQKELQHIGQQAVQNKEVYAQGTAADANTFGYADRYAEYRHQPSTIASEFRTTFNYWHMGREFSSLPTLNQDFTDCDPSKRNYAVQDKDVLWIMASNSIQSRRLVDANAGGRIF